MRFDEILETIGGFGRYQKWIFFLTCLPNLLAGFFMLNPVFILGIPDHRCAIPGYENDTFEIQDEVHEAIVNRYIPHSKQMGQEYDSCKLFLLQSYNASVKNNRNDSSNSMANSTDEIKCSRWVYDKSVFHKTFASQMDLVCDKEIWVANAEMIFYGGMLFGSLASGILADRYGRKPVMYVATLIMTATSIGLSWAYAYWLFCVLEFFLGGAIESVFMPAYIISLEMTSASKRVWPGVISNFPFVLGLVLLAVTAYRLRDWFEIQLYTSLPGAICILYWWLMPESPRWLLTKGRQKEAEIIIRRAAKWNKATLPEKLFDEKTLEEYSQQNSSFLQLFSTKTLCIRTFLIFFNWTVVSLVYFGLALNSENLAGNLYLNFALSGIVEIPGYVLVFYLVDRVGRRRLFCVFMIIGGVSCVSSIFPIEFESEASDVAVIALSMFGRLCVTAAYITTYIHSPELFPTVVRNAGMGGASLFARVGTMIAPYIVTMSDSIGGSVRESLPLMVFGGVAFLSAISSLLLPETLNKSLPDSVSEGKKFGRSGAFSLVAGLRFHDGKPDSDRVRYKSSEQDLLLSTEISDRYS